MNCDSTMVHFGYDTELNVVTWSSTAADTFLPTRSPLQGLRSGVLFVSSAVVEKGVII